MLYKRQRHRQWNTDATLYRNYSCLPSRFFFQRNVGQGLYLCRPPSPVCGGQLPIHPGWMLIALNRKELTSERIQAWLQSIPKPTAIFTADYEMALVTYQTLHRLKWRVPTDISLVSFDDPISAAFLTPPLTTVRQPIAEIGKRAVEKLMQAIQKGKFPEGTEILMPELVVRASTAPPKPEGKSRHK